MDVSLWCCCVLSLEIDGLVKWVAPVEPWMAEKCWRGSKLKVCITPYMSI